MNKSDLTDIIRKMVVEEVKNQFPSLLAEILNSKKSVIKESNKGQSVQRTRPKIDISTGNPKFDAILRETTPGFSGGYTGPNVDVDGGFGFIGEGINIPETSVHVDEIPSTVSLKHDLFQRDFSAILKKSSQLKSKTGPL